MFQELILEGSFFFQVNTFVLLPEKYTLSFRKHKVSASFCFDEAKRRYLTGTSIVNYVSLKSLKLHIIYVLHIFEARRHRMSKEPVRAIFEEHNGFGFITLIASAAFIYILKRKSSLRVVTSLGS